jgi:O-acetylserine/cysteine efflux transporter
VKVAALPAYRKECRPNSALSTGFILLCAVLLFGASWPVVKVAIVASGATSIWMAASRSGLASFALLLVVVATGHLRRPSRSDLPTLLAIGILQLTIFFLLCHCAVQVVPAGHTAILSNATIIWIVPLATILRVLSGFVPIERFAG